MDYRISLRTKRRRQGMFEFMSAGLENRDHLHRSLINLRPYCQPATKEMSYNPKIDWANFPYKGISSFSRPILFIKASVEISSRRGNFSALYQISQTKANKSILAFGKVCNHNFGTFLLKYSPLPGKVCVSSFKCAPDAMTLI